MTNDQAANPNQIPSTSDQLGIAIWSLIGICGLVIGHSNFDSAVSSNRKRKKEPFRRGREGFFSVSRPKLEPGPKLLW